MVIEDPLIESERIFSHENGWQANDQKERASLELLTLELGAELAQRMAAHYGDQLRHVWRWKGGSDWLVKEGGRTVSSSWHMNPNEYQERLAEAIPLKVAS